MMVVVSKSLLAEMIPTLPMMCSLLSFLAKPQHKMTWGEVPRVSGTLSLGR